MLKQRLWPGIMTLLGEQKVNRCHVGRVGQHQDTVHEGTIRLCPSLGSAKLTRPYQAAYDAISQELYDAIS